MSVYSTTAPMSVCRTAPTVKPLICEHSPLFGTAAMEQRRISDGASVVWHPGKGSITGCAPLLAPNSGRPCSPRNKDEHSQQLEQSRRERRTPCSQ